MTQAILEIDSEDIPVMLYRVFQCLHNCGLLKKWLFKKRVGRKIWFQAGNLLIEIQQWNDLADFRDLSRLKFNSTDDHRQAIKVYREEREQLIERAQRLDQLLRKSLGVG